MVRIDINGNIELNRGDSFMAPLFLDVSKSQFGSTRFPLEDHDRIYLGIMEANVPFEFALVRKEYTKDDVNGNGDLIIQFDPTDTERLLPGVYFYEIKFLRPAVESGDKEYVMTVSPRRKFTILE